MTYKLHKLNQGGTNAQGVPLGLVNWMCLNRLRTPRHNLQSTSLAEILPVLELGKRRLRKELRRKGDIRHPAAQPGRFALLLWADLALTKRDEFKNQGFVTINAFEWRRH